MDVQYRRKVQLLWEAKPNFHVYVRQGGSVENATYDDRPADRIGIVEINDVQNSIKVEVGALREWIPLDGIETIWRSGDRWNIQLNGALWIINSDAPQRLVFELGRRA